MLEQYAEKLGPYAIKQARSMLDDLNVKTFEVWRKVGERLGKEWSLRKEFAGQRELFDVLIREQILLISSIPLDVAQKVQELKLEVVTEGVRASEIVMRLKEIGDMPLNKVKVIARTEASKAQTAIMRARASEVNSPGYTWRTGQDLDVRASHKKMEGEFVRWDTPPTLDNMIGHAGEFPNCRCWPEIVL